jgi:glycosyltransferase involved in cell wall biosynthesis
VRLFDLHSSRVLTSLPSLVSYLRQQRPAALISSMDHANVVALWARKLARVSTRVIVISHCLPASEATAATRLRGTLVPFFMRRCYAWADAWVAVSAGTADEVARLSGIDRDLIEVIPNPVICPELFQLAAAPIDHEWFAPNQPPVVLGVGRVVAQKRFDILLEAFAQLQVPARLVVLGDGPERATLVTRAQELGLDANVSFPGFVANPYPYMARASVVVLPAAYEAFGLVLVEALALGTPAISTDTAGGREILGSSRGQLVPVGDVAQLAAAINIIIGVSKPAVVEDLRRYTVARVLGEYQRIIRTVMDCDPT